MATLPERYTSMFNEREQQHIEFCKVYTENFGHGAPGHLDMLVIGKLVDALNMANDRACILADQIRDAGLSEDA